MITATKISEVRAAVREWKQQGFTVGLVPTMGYLHDGHASLVDCASSMCDKVVVSDFVNPTQFSPADDLEAYPRDFEHDCEILRKHNCDMVFYPSVDEMYPDGNGKTDTYVEILNDMTSQLARELTKGIRDEVEDVASMFKKMAIIKDENEAVEDMSDYIISDDTTAENQIHNVISISEKIERARLIAMKLNSETAKKQVKENNYNAGGQLSLFDLIAS